MEEIKKTKRKRGKTFLPAQDRHRALHPAERRGLPRPRFRPGWNPCPAWGPVYYYRVITVNTTNFRRSSGELQQTESRKQPQQWSVGREAQTHCTLKGLHELKLSPHVDDVSLTSSMVEVVKDDVAVSSVKLSVRGWIHGHFVRSLNTPYLTKTKKCFKDGRLRMPKKQIRA